VAQRLEVEVDQSVCIGAGECVRVAAATFALDEDGLAVVLDPTATDEQTLLAAERSCPTGALRVSGAAG
jgi:ferredoxin